LINSVTQSIIFLSMTILKFYIYWFVCQTNCLMLASD